MNNLPPLLIWAIKVVVPQANIMDPLARMGIDSDDVCNKFW